MIKQLNTAYIQVESDSNAKLELANKINELVNAANELQENQNTYWTDIAEIKKELQTRAENVQDKFAEQRRWMGCVCRFWCDNPNDTLLDYLGKIQMGEIGVEYYAKESGDWFPNCEPVLPTDNAIYKG